MTDSTHGWDWSHYLNPKIDALLEDAAPMTAALTRRVAAQPPLKHLAAMARKNYRDAYCGGQIEASLRKALGGA